MTIIDVVKWNGDPNIFAWKYPESNLSTKTQLIVHETQEAVLFSKGKLLSKFKAGKYTLSTENIPILRDLYGIPFGGVNPFTAEVWYVSNIDILDIKWGTPQPLQIKDHLYNVIIPIRAFGQMGISITDSEKFLLKLVGTLNSFNREDISSYFKGVLLAEATTVIAKKIIDEKISILDLPAHYVTLSDSLKEILLSKFEEYGISIKSFFINNISFPESDATIIKLKAMMTKRAEMSMLNYTYQQERTFDFMNNAAQNKGAAGSTMSAGIGMGLGVNIGNTMGNMMQNMSSNIQPTSICKHCNSQISEEVVFCPSCGQHNIKDKIQHNTIIKCNVCNQTIAPDDKFCRNCGDKYHKCPFCEGDIDPDVSTCPLCNNGLPSRCCNCNTELSMNAKFCSQCGTTTTKKCECGTINTPGAKYCTECGIKI